MKRLKLTQNKYALIDDKDFEKVSIRKWSYHHTGYVVGGYPQVSLHRFIMDAGNRQYIDHINRNKLDNRRKNLRFCTPTQNQYNSIPKRAKLPKGLYWRGDRRAWVVRIKSEGKRLFIGYYKRLGDARKACKEAVLKYHGEFARTHV